MRSFYLAAFLLTAAVSASAQVDVGFSYSLSLPQHEMKGNINPLHSLNFIFTSRIKGVDKFSWGMETGFGQYAYFTKEQDIRFPDGSGIRTDVTYSSNVTNVGVLARYNFFKEAVVNPYLSGKLGYAYFFSKVYVADPDDIDNCKPLDKKTPIADHSFFASYGAGMKIDMNKKKGKAWVDISVNQLHGTKLDYINVKDIKDHVHNDPNNPTPPSNKSTPLSIRFVNVATQTIHEHQLAEVYTSPLRMLEMKVSVIWRLNTY